MQGFSGLLLSKSSDRLTPESADFLRRIIDATTRMDALIRDSLQYAKVVRERLPLVPVEPLPVLRGILESYPGFQSPDVDIQVAQPLPKVMANEAGLAQCFANLLSNAIKFVKPGIKPHIRIWAEEVGRVTPCAPALGLTGSVGGEARGKVATSIHSSTNPPGAARVRFWFEDNGIGIPAQYQKRIFDMFQQLDKSYEGTGIGLALVRKTVERMNGKVGVESEPGKGSRFWLEFKKTQSTNSPRRFAAPKSDEGGSQMQVGP